MKSYTDLEQSKKLAEILSIESADMVYIKHATSNNPDWRFDDDIPPMILGKASIKDMTVEVLPCWSLAALLDIIRNAIGYTLQTTYNKNPKVFIVCELGDKPYSIESTEYDNEVDACYDMILNLHELNLL